MGPNKTTPEVALLPDMESLNLDDEDISPSAIRAELKRTNKTLRLSAIQKHEPYELLPYQYFPIKVLDHQPPLFMYGLPLDLEEIRQYIRHPDSSIPPEILDKGVMFQLYIFVKHLRTVFGLPNAVLPWHIARCDNRLVFQMMTNYDTRGITEEEVEKVIAVCKQLFQRSPMWYLSSMLKPKRDYSIPESKCLE
ncbi:hypothetical protein BD779DRAFT_1674031 [Infundibulicybe gibba]|nr:hypothetical protein BD779DRAFT_1674031 [Infundibulicybe gibba]